MNLKIKNVLFLISVLLLVGFVNALSYPYPDGASVSYDGTVNYPVDNFGVQSATCSVDNIVFKLSSVDNAHAALFSDISGLYNVNSCFPYDSGREFKTFIDPNGVLPEEDNVILRLSGNSNAHAEKKELVTSGYENVIFGELICRYAEIGKSCEENFQDNLDIACFGAISGNTNAHVSDCASADSNGYQKICCQPRCRVKISYTEYDPVNNINKEIRSAFWEYQSDIIESANINKIIQIKIEGDSYCADKEINFGVYQYKTDTSDDLVTLGNGEFSPGDIFNSQSNPDGDLISCTNGDCNVRFGNDNKIYLSLNLVGNKFNKDKQYYFNFLMNGQNYYSNLLTIRETITTGCGNGIIETSENEVCEPELSDRPTCRELGFDGSDMINTKVGCTSQCRFDTSMCTCDSGSETCVQTGGSCGGDSSVLNPGEECDDQSITKNGIGCSTLNLLWAGALSCNDQCKFDISKCGGYCGNNIREDLSLNPDGTPREPELCDKEDIPITCGDLGFSGGVIDCSASCTFDTTQCLCDPGTTTCTTGGYCGDGLPDPSNNEQCDGDVASGLNCKSISSAWEGDLICNDDCTLNINDCVGTCLNGRLDDNEICDPTAIGTVTNPNPRISDCSELGFKEGEYIKCTSECELDTSQCSCPEDDENCQLIGSCGDDVLNPGEECDDDSLQNVDINSCNDISSIWGGDLSCNEATCKIDFSDCEAIETRECKSCDDCNTFFGNCGQDQCVNFCGLDEGGCYLDNNLIDECTSCNEITKCEDYDNSEDCEAHRNEGLPGGRCIGYALSDNGQVADCKWDGNSCEENKACVWQCPDLDSTYGECQADDFRYPISGVTPKCTSNNLDCGVNGIISLPDKIKCGKYSEEKTFPVFDNLNIIMSIILLTCYYLVIFKKRKN